MLQADNKDRNMIEFEGYLKSKKPCNPCNPCQKSFYFLSPISDTLRAAWVNGCIKLSSITKHNSSYMFIQRCIPSAEYDNFNIGLKCCTR